MGDWQPDLAVGAVLLAALAAVTSLATAGAVLAGAALLLSLQIALTEHRPTPRAHPPAAPVARRPDLVTHHPKRPKQPAKEPLKTQLDYDRWDKVDWEREAERAGPPTLQTKPYVPQSMTAGQQPGTAPPALQGLLQQLVPSVLAPFAVKKYEQHRNSKGFVLMRTSHAIAEIQAPAPDAKPWATLKYIDIDAAAGFYAQHQGSSQMKEYLSTALEKYNPEEELIVCVALPDLETNTSQTSSDGADATKGTMSSMRIQLTKPFKELQKHAGFTAEVLRLELKPSTALQNSAS